jgi:diguanylate cyclase (GGDEF)-like protein
MNVREREFVDYYRILQVHQDAEPEIIKSAYRRLAQLNHPDANPDPGSADRMKLINRAYETISNSELRRAYHKVWLLNHQKHSPRGPLSWDHPASEAQQALDMYFRCIFKEDWAGAYQSLTQKDRSRVPLSDFCEWKKVVARLYQMGSYAIKPFREYERCLVGRTEYERVHAFSVFLTDRDRRSGTVGEETYTKYVVWDRDKWSVCLGYDQLKSIIYKMRYLASHAPHMDPGRVYMDTMLKYDKLTGFLSRSGLAGDMDKEIARARRFKSSFSIAVLTVEPSGKIPNVSGGNYMQMCLSDASAQLKKILRATDYAARISENQLAVLLIETNRLAAAKALKRFLNAIRPGEGLQYRLGGSITPYQGESAEDTCIRALNDARTEIIAGEGNVRKYHIKLDDRQI